MTIEGNGVTAALASSQKQAVKIERSYRAVAGGLEGRLERRDTTVYLWQFTSSPAQRQAMYDCQYWDEWWADARLLALPRGSTGLSRSSSEIQSWRGAVWR